MVETIHSLSLSSCQDPAPDICKHDDAVAVRSLTDLAAQVIAQNLERYDPQVLTPEYLSFGMAALIVRRLRTSTDGKVALGNWTWFASQFGVLTMKLLEADLIELESSKPPSQPSPFARTDTVCPDARTSAVARHRTAYLPYDKLVNGLLLSPPSSPLLNLNVRSTELITSLCLSDTTFGDSHALSLKELRFLTVLETERTSITDLGIYQLASALYRPVGAEERRGLYGLAAWSLNGCKGVTDRSTKRLVEWERLNYLDLRQTSCVFPTYLRILNRHLSLHPSLSSPDRWKMVPALDFSLGCPSLLQTILHSAPLRLGSSPDESSYVSLEIQSARSIADSHKTNQSRRRLPFREPKEDDCVLVRTISSVSLSSSKSASGIPDPTSRSTSRKRTHLSTIETKPDRPDLTHTKKRPRQTASSSRRTGSILDEILLGIQPVQPASSGKANVSSSADTKTSSCR